MKNLFIKYKKQSVIIAIILTLILFVIYLRALFLPGLWHSDAFLYLQEDSSFIGSDFYADYKMVIKSADYGADIDFSVNDKTKHYQLKYDKTKMNMDVEIFEADKLLFKGQAFGIGDEWLLHSEDSESPDNIVVQTGTIPDEEELFPGYTRLFNWAVSEKTDTRGEPYMIFFILIAVVFLALDIKFPKLFWTLEHRLSVYGGEPSDFYIFGQKVGRIIMLLAILVCMVLTFTLH